MYKEIADNLRISLETVRTHVQRIYRKLGARSRAEVLLKHGAYEPKPRLPQAMHQQSGKR